MKLNPLPDHVEILLVLNKERGLSHAGKAEVWY
jgi:hypothetical protein